MLPPPMTIANRCLSRLTRLLKSKKRGRRLHFDDRYEARFRGSAGRARYRVARFDLRQLPARNRQLAECLKLAHR